MSWAAHAQMKEKLGRAWMCTVVVATLLAGCTNVDLMPNRREGSTLPVPDFAKITFSYALQPGLTSTDIIISGEEGATLAGATVEARNLRTDTTDVAVATSAGSFYLPLVDSLLGDSVEVSITLGEEFSELTDFELDTEADGPPMVMEEFAERRELEPDTFDITGFFPTPRPVMVVVANEDTGEVVRQMTAPEGENRRFEAPIKGDLGHTVTIYAVDAERGNLPGPLQRLILEGGG